MATRLSFRLVFACLLTLCACYYMFGQTTGRIAGVVKDPSGGVVAQAGVQGVSEETNETWNTTTDQEGNYAFFLLPPGRYRIEITAASFKTAVLTDVSVRITETTVADVTLAIGGRVETVVVKDNPSLVQTDSPQLGWVVDSQAVANLPLASRNFTQILSLSPGTATYLPDSTAVGRNTQAISVNGARVTQNFFQINGIDATTMGTNGVILVGVPAPETIEQFKVQTSLYDAGYGRSGGGNIQVVTKSGGNQVHGTAYEYFRNEVLDAPGTDIGDVGRNCLRGPRQVNLDFALAKLFPLAESQNFEFRAESFNLFNHANLANPISNLNALFGSGGSTNPTTGQVLNAGNFGHIISTSNNPRILQFAFKFNF